MTENIIVLNYFENYTFYTIEMIILIIAFYEISILRLKIKKCRCQEIF